MPQDAEDYVHRVGRTARAASTGMAITFVNEKDMYRVRRVEQLIEREIPKLDLPEDFGPGPVYDPNKKQERSHGGNRGAQGNRSRSNDRNRSGNRDRNKPRSGPRPEQKARTGETGNATVTEQNGSDRPIKPFKPRNRNKNNRGPAGNAAPQTPPTE